MNILIAGASGLVGGELLQLALKNESISSVHLINRRTLELEHPKLIQHIIDFSSLEKWESPIQFDAIFCSLGTTIKTAGSQEKFRMVDYDYVVNLAKWAQSNKVKKFLVLSAMGADINSSIFYSKVKGQMQEAISKLAIPSISILQPSLLMGERSEYRLGEKIGISIMSVLNFLLIGRLKKYKGIQAKTVAKAMLNLSKNSEPGVTITRNDELFNLGI